MAKTDELDSPQERTEIIVDHWLRTGSVPDQKQVSVAENLLLPTPIQNGALPLRILPLRKAAASVEGLGELLERHRRQKYLIQPRRKGRGRLPFTHRKVIVFSNFWRHFHGLLEKTDAEGVALTCLCDVSVSGTLSLLEKLGRCLDLGFGIRPGIRPNMVPSRKPCYFRLWVRTRAKVQGMELQKKLGTCLRGLRLWVRKHYRLLYVFTCFVVLLLQPEA